MNAVAATPKCGMKRELTRVTGLSTQHSYYVAKKPRYSHNEVRNWMSAFLDTETGQGVNETIVSALITMLDNTITVAQEFRMARDWLSEVAALITNDFGDGLHSKDIVMDSKDGVPKRISKLYLSYMALQYPLLFP
ncbi:hypothetical protein Tco_0669116 [Tanacetum coccineum]